jgi:hypothetical protein
LRLQDAMGAVPGCCCTVLGRDDLSPPSGYQLDSWGDNWIEACDCRLHIQTLQTSTHLPGLGAACCVIACQLVSEFPRIALPNTLPCLCSSTACTSSPTRWELQPSSASAPQSRHGNRGVDPSSLSCGGGWKMAVLYSMLPCCA